MIVVAALVALAVFAVLCEAAARAIAHVRPEPLRWHDLFTQRREDQMRLLARNGGVDVVVVGASDAQFSVDPEVLARGLGRTCYNASIYRGIPTVTERWLADRVFDLLKPRVLVLGVSPVVLNDDTPLKSRLDEYLAAPVFHAGRVRQWHWRLGRRSLAFRYVGLLRRPRRLVSLLGTVIRQPATWQWSVPAVIPGELDELGRCTTLLHRSFGHGPRMLNLIHQQAGRGFCDRGEQLAAIVRMIRLAQDRGVTPIIAMTPMSSDLIDDVLEGGRPRYFEIADRIRRAAVAAGATVIDVGRGLEQREVFADMLHTNGLGQAEFSRRLTEALQAELSAVHQPRTAPAATQCLDAASAS